MSTAVGNSQRSPKFIENCSNSDNPLRSPSLSSFKWRCFPLMSRPMIFADSQRVNHICPAFDLVSDAVFDSSAQIDETAHGACHHRCIIIAKSLSR